MNGSRLSTFSHKGMYSPLSTLVDSLFKRLFQRSFPTHLEQSYFIVRLNILAISWGIIWQWVSDVSSFSIITKLIQKPQNTKLSLSTDVHPFLRVITIKFHWFKFPLPYHFHLVKRKEPTSVPNIDYGD